MPSWASANAGDSAPVRRILHRLATLTDPSSLPCLLHSLHRHDLFLTRPNIAISFISACVRLRHPHLAFCFLRSHSQPHSSHFHLLFPSHKLRSFSLMLSLLVPPSPLTFPLLLSSLSSPLQVRLVHAHVIRSGFHPSDPHLRNSLLARYASLSRDLSPALRLFDEMPVRDVIAWTTLVTTFKNRGNASHALWTFGTMCTVHGIVPNRVTMVSVLGACAMRGDVLTGIWVHRYVKRSGWEVDVVLGTALVDMYGKCGRVHDSVRVFVEMKSKNIYTWNSLICGFAAARSGGEALEWFNRMEEGGVRPDAVTLVGVLSACNASGLTDAGRRIFSSLLEGEYGFPPGIKHYGCMVDLLRRTGELEEAFELAATMPFTPNVVLWGSLLGGSYARGCLAMSEVAARQLVELEPGNAAHYVLLSSLYADMGRWADVEGVWRLMRRRGFRKTAGMSLGSTKMSEDRYGWCPR